MASWRPGDKSDPENCPVCGGNPSQCDHPTVRPRPIKKGSCGEPEIHFLTVEHKGGVPDHHKWPSGNRKTGIALFKLIRDEGYPDDYTVLCMNCNYAKGHYGFCPHQPHEESDRRY